MPGGTSYFGQQFFRKNYNTIQYLYFLANAEAFYSAKVYDGNAN